MIRLCILLLAASCFLASLPKVSANNDDAIVLSSYHVSTNVNSRLATTSIDMVFENIQDCASVYATTIQLPVDGRVTELVMNLSDGCQLESQVKNLDEAVEDFEGFSDEGKAAVILTAWDMTNYNLQVSIPPNGVTSVTLKYQELLVQKLDQVSFQVPMFPGMAVDDLKIDVAVEDPNMVNGFDTELQDELIVTSLTGGRATMHYENRKVTEENALPTLFRANFQPGRPPEQGLMLSDGECFTHVFNPSILLSNLGSMSRKIVFVIDVSGSMSGQKLMDVKASFVLMIDTLDERDTLILQTFSNEGTESQWGPKPAKAENKKDAEAFVKKLVTIGSTNLKDAFLDGIENVRDAPETVAPILVIMTDGYGSSEPSEVARSVRESNEGGKVKIFSLAFGENADMDLLLGIAIQNGGRAVRIYEGFGDAADQMEQFYKQELGSVLMSDINVSYDFGDIDVSDSTTSSFPILAGGSEIVVRGKIDSSAIFDASGRSVKSLVSASSAKGLVEVPVDHLVIPDNSAGSDCRQTFAQARIVELLEYRDVTNYIGNDFLVDTPVSRTSMLDAQYFEDEAQKIALDAGLVWPGLTALVTVENANCQQNNSDVCYSGVESDDPFDDFAESWNAPNGKATAGYTSGVRESPRTSWGQPYWFLSLILVSGILSSVLM
eukprot:CAMPEP_0116137930 /NCGR_PEP_ID=MMETSP0329-20121206/12503_1 /TAXON_ID=697910 /ORGANISM="Pseudo-nitzschia arenysensis, Strain B593" /LENGTH=664 /DNA_ID=CAMNT_0003632863 /DNA_START=21 /DNA_END=2015 /DNA_ORIENTATION=-